MPNEIKLRRSYAVGAVPTANELATHECCVNWADRKLFVKNTAGQIVTVTLGGGGSANIVEAATTAGFPAVGASGTLYIATDTSREFRFDSSGVYVEIGN